MDMNTHPVPLSTTPTDLASARYASGHRLANSINNIGICAYVLATSVLLIGVLLSLNGGSIVSATVILSTFIFVAIGIILQGVATALTAILDTALHTYRIMRTHQG